MTVNYNLLVSSCSGWAKLKLLFKWRGSIWKAVYKELFGWLTMYFMISLTYRHVLNKNQRESFEKVVEFLDNKTLDYIPLNFMLGFFVSEVMRRWNTYISCMALPDNIALATVDVVKGETDEIRMVRRNIVRYAILSQVLLYRDISMQVRKRFPTLDTVVAGRFMLPHEKEAYEALDEEYDTYWVPLMWGQQLVGEARKRNIIKFDGGMGIISKELGTFRQQLSMALKYDWVPIPIIYPQLVIFTVHLFFFITLFSRQILETTEVDIYFPVMTLLQFVAYIGWTKVAEALMNPMGEDDDDFESNWLLDRNLKVCLDIVDKHYGKMPEIMKDEFWGTDNQPLYAENSRPVHPMAGSAANVDLTEDISEVTMVPLVDGETHADVTRLRDRRPSRGSQMSIVPIKRKGTGMAPPPTSIMGNMRRRLTMYRSNDTPVQRIIENNKDNGFEKKSNDFTSEPNLATIESCSPRQTRVRFGDQASKHEPKKPDRPDDEHPLLIVDEDPLEVVVGGSRDLLDKIDEMEETGELSELAEPAGPVELTHDSTAGEVVQWLRENGCSKSIVDALSGLDGSSLFALAQNKFDDKIGKEEAARLYEELIVRKQHKSTSEASKPSKP